MNRPRLLVLASTFPARTGDGTPGFVRALAGVEATEFDTVVLVPRVPGSLRTEQIDGFRVVRFGYFPRRWEDLADGAIIENLRARRSRLLQVPFFLAFEALALRRLVREHRPDVLHVHWVLPQGVAALLVARRVPWLVTTLGGDVYALNDPLSRWLKRAVLRRAKAVTTMNADMQRRLLDLGAPVGETLVLPMGADVDGVRRAGVGVVREPGRLLFVGRLVEKKGLAVLLEALRTLPGAWSLDVAGDGPLRAELERRAEGLPVRFLGQTSTSDLARAYAACEVLVAPSVPAASGDQDGLPVALLEAMSAGCPVVASRIAGIDEAVVDGESGLLVTPGSARDLTAALALLLRDSELRTRIGAGAKARAEGYSVASLGRRYVELLQRVAGRG